tara:strand:- start:20 stop:505 length:486 start_codon:yes stop_codon:yes gene_type:complete
LYTYYNIDFGITFNNKKKNSLLDSFYKVFVEIYDFDRIENFEEGLEKQLEEELKEDGIVIEEEELFYKLINWMIKNKKILDFNTHYHGSAESTPTNLVFKNYKINNQDDIYNFTWSKKDIEKINNNLSEILDFCKETMPEDLFEYLTENNLIGVTFLNVSS